MDVLPGLLSVNVQYMYVLPQIDNVILYLLLMRSQQLENRSSKGKLTDLASAQHTQGEGFV